jgi:hypothetical protein
MQAIQICSVKNKVNNQASTLGRKIKFCDKSRRTVDGKQDWKFLALCLVNPEVHEVKLLDIPWFRVKLRPKL